MKFYRPIFLLISFIVTVLANEENIGNNLPTKLAIGQSISDVCAAECGSISRMKASSNIDVIKRKKRNSEECCCDQDYYLCSSKEDSPENGGGRMVFSWILMVSVVLYHL